ncbi:hypothetical protein ACFSKU_01305 [Pontibacter silvestris]|uniref:Uncharacterized protein n=1 Tax=Pontibacter silvestris TaxID=2305183 RepID=A0ABW4WSV8_9BACT|nr:hypothetical protein [Pontibacter silvestris]MCC9136246.1 hypothetical protein [Pontibacter silvestris]
MDPITNSIPLIEKEQISQLHFSREDVLQDEAARKKRLWDLNRANSLGNAYHGKVEITFQTSDGKKKRVDTTILL